MLFRSGDTVEAMLVEAVAGCLERQMLDSCPLGARQQFMQTHRVRRGMGNTVIKAGAMQAERAEAGTLHIKQRPDLRGEIRHRGLAVGAGDGRNGRRSEEHTSELQSL